MAIVTLISDFGLRDHYVSSVKGKILSKLPDVTIVDISHEIVKQNIQGAAFLLKETFGNFPAKTVHVIGLLTEFKDKDYFVAAEHKGHYFVSADNGFFSLLFDEPMEKVIEVKVDRSTNLTFPVKDFYVDAACRLANGEAIESLGNPKPDLLQMLPFRATSMGDNLRGSIVYIDSYDNVVTNIDKALFEQVGKGGPFVIELARGNSIESISKDYSDVPEGEILAIFNASNNLEIAIRNGKLRSLLGLKLNDSITVRF